MINADLAKCLLFLLFSLYVYFYMITFASCNVVIFCPLQNLIYAPCGYHNCQHPALWTPPSCMMWTAEACWPCSCCHCHGNRCQPDSHAKMQRIIITTTNIETVPIVCVCIWLHLGIQTTGVALYKISQELQLMIKKHLHFLTSK